VLRRIRIELLIPAIERCDCIELAGASTSLTDEDGDGPDWFRSATLPLPPLGSSDDLLWFRPTGPVATRDLARRKRPRVRRWELEQLLADGSPRGHRRGFGPWRHHRKVVEDTTSTVEKVVEDTTGREQGRRGHHRHRRQGGRRRPRRRRRRGGRGHHRHRQGRRGHHRHRRQGRRGHHRHARRNLVEDTTGRSTPLGPLADLARRRPSGRRRRVPVPSPSTAPAGRTGPVRGRTSTDRPGHHPRRSSPSWSLGWAWTPEAGCASTGHEPVDRKLLTQTETEGGA
jgi:hypothetical protein